LETVKQSEIRAQRDNDLIYHQDVPSSAALPPLQKTVLVSATVPKGLSNPQSMLVGQHVLFSDLAGWGTQEAISTHHFSSLAYNWLDDHL
jgi:programmed cell death 6-interacting protein